MRPRAVLETILYAQDLDAAEAFYRDVLGLEPVSKQPGRQVFYRLEKQMLLIFNPDATVLPPAPDAIGVARGIHGLVQRPLAVGLEPPIAHPLLGRAPADYSQVHCQ